MITSLPISGTYLELSPTEGWIPAYPLASQWRMKTIPDSDGLPDPSEGRCFWTNHKRVALLMLQHGESADMLADMDIIESAQVSDVWLKAVADVDARIDQAISLMPPARP